MPTVGDSSPLQILAFDHRGSYSNGIFDAKDPNAAQSISRSKVLIYEGFLEMKGQSEMGKVEGLGVLADEQFSMEVIKRAPTDGVVFGMPAEDGYAPHFTLEAPSVRAAVDRIIAARPRFVKVLAKVSDDASADAPWLQVLRDFSDAVHRIDWSSVAGSESTTRCGALLVEPIIPGNAQENADDFEHRTNKAIDLIDSAGIQVDIWKLQPQGNREAMERVASKCKNMNPAVGVVLLGQGMAMEQLKIFVRWAAEMQPLYCGFAIGRTVWADAVKQWAAYTGEDIEGRDQELRQTVAQRFAVFVAAWQEGAESREGPQSKKQRTIA